MSRSILLITLAGAVVLASVPASAVEMSPGAHQDLPVIKDTGNTLPADRKANTKGQNSKEQVIEKVHEKKEAIDKAPPAKIDSDPIGD